VRSRWPQVPQAKQSSPRFRAPHAIGCAR
jgi:hypothetical protein